MLRASDLRRRVVLQSRVQTGDGYGNLVRGWTDYLAGMALGPAKSVTAVASGATTLIGCTEHGFVEGQLVQLAGITGLPGLPTTFGVLAQDADSFRIALDSSTLTLAVSGATATPMGGVPAELTPMSGREQVTAEAVTPMLMHRLRVRYHQALLDPVRVAGLRALFVQGAVSRYFDLTAALNVDSRNREIGLTATEGLTG